jgi:hypothetical protein
MHLPTLTHLDLKGIKSFPISDLITCSNLQHLSTNGLLIADKNDAALSSLLHKPIQLHEFDITLTPEVLGLLDLKCSDGRPVLDFTFLEKICIAIGWIDCDGDETIALDILNGTQQLKDISLTIWYDFVQDIDFSETIAPSLHTLRRLHLAVHGYPAATTAEFCDMLDKLSGKNRLESLEIELEAASDDTDWSRLDKILLTPGWSMLKHVSITIIHIKQGNNSLLDATLESLSQNQFVGLASSKKLNFSFSVREQSMSF